MKYIANSSNKKNSKKLKLFLISSVVIAMGSIGVLAYKDRTAPLLDVSQVENANFPVYLPKQAPDGYKVNKERVNMSGRSLGYEFKSDSGDNNIVVTVQPLPANFDMSKMIGDGSVDKTNTDNGVLYNLTANNKNQYLLNTGDALIFFTATNSINTATITSLVNNLKKQN